MAAISMNSPIDLHMTTPGRAKILVDGIDLSNLVYRVEFVMQTNRISQLVLYCHAADIAIHGVGDVVVGERIEKVPSLRSIFHLDDPDPPSQA
jgi:hypothetical protein